MTAPMRVAGTRIDPALDDDRERTLVVSDLHVRHEGGPVVAALEQVLADAQTSPRTTRVLILGDLFDYFVGSGQLRYGAWRDVADQLQRTAESGVSVTVLRGNRDFMLGQRFARRTGCRVMRGGLAFRLGDRRVVALHGDELCQRDLPYQRAKRWLRSPWTRGLVAAVPYAVADRLGRRARRRSVAVQDQAQTGSRHQTSAADPHRFEPVSDAVAEAFLPVVGADLLIFGHIHRPARGQFGAADRDGEGDQVARQREYCILPAFDDEPVLLEHRGQRLWYRHADGQPRDDYPPRSFPDGLPGIQP